MWNCSRIQLSSSFSSLHLRDIITRNNWIRRSNLRVTSIIRQCVVINPHGVLIPVLGTPTIIMILDSLPLLVKVSHFYAGWRDCAIVLIFFFLSFQRQRVYAHVDKLYVGNGECYRKKDSPTIVKLERSRGTLRYSKLVPRDVIHPI